MRWPDPTPAEPHTTQLDLVPCRAVLRGCQCSVAAWLRVPVVRAGFVSEVKRGEYNQRQEIGARGVFGRRAGGCA
jgi:hypothetical protein